MSTVDQRAPSADRVSVNHAREVLVVDDEPGILELLAEFFRGLGFKVTLFSDGRAAMRALEREPDRYWLVVTDIIMPGADGLAVVRAAKTANPELRVVIITGYASLATAVEAVRLGAFDYLSKPFTLREIETTLQRLSRRLELERENRELSDDVQLHRSSAPVAGRLDEIGVRLDRVERLLQSLTAALAYDR